MPSTDISASITVIGVDMFGVTEWQETFTQTLPWTNDCAVFSPGVFNCGTFATYAAVFSISEDLPVSTGNNSTYTIEVDAFSTTLSPGEVNIFYSGPPSNGQPVTVLSEILAAQVPEPNLIFPLIGLLILAVCIRTRS